MTISRRNDSTGGHPPLAQAVWFGGDKDVWLGRGKPDCPGSRWDTGGFAYMFPEAPDLRHQKIASADLDALADAMVEQAGDAVASNSVMLPPILTYVTQFVSQDISLPGHGPEPRGPADGKDDKPIARKRLARAMANVHRGRLQLNALYGDGDGDGADGSDGPARWLRDPGDPAQLIVPGWLSRPNGTSSSREGVASKEGNLIVHQFRIALMRFHNHVARSCDVRSVKEFGRDAVFAWAQREVRHAYQWLVVNELLRRICGGALLDEVLDRCAPLYAMFARETGGNRARPNVPVEFYAAAFRFSDSMVRESYDYNSALGRPSRGATNLLKSAPLRLLLRGGGVSVALDGPYGDLLAREADDVFRIDWSRFTASPSAEYPERSARKIDTRIASAPQTSQRCAAQRRVPVLGQSARYNLRSGHLLNVPSGQACVERINRRLGTGIAPLTAEELLSGPTGPVLSTSALRNQTPLWFYILKEAEIRAGGEGLGPLGARLVAETVVGLIQTDPDSYWNRPGSDAGHWAPWDSSRLFGAPVLSFADLIDVAERA